MTESARAAVVREYVKRIDVHDIDGAYQSVADDFRYIIEPKPEGMTEAGYNKENYKKYELGLVSDSRNWQSTIDTIDESGDSIQITGNTKFQHKIKHPDGSSPYRDGNSVWKAELQFDGDKIKLVKSESISVTLGKP
ncbi:unnamed protein product [Rhizoctonia solani]|uniref:Uncharacterized protein n=1 Tax=Rhizoctonia solani TaxID=456999 RepID=A0A8H3B831_9AGAM|nr:unnamed protein product [Rhizoctonia solani]